MKFIPWDVPFTNVEWLFCDALVSDCDQILKLDLFEYHVGTPDPSARDIEDPVDRLVASGNPVEKTRDSKKWRVTFDPFVSFRVVGESYASKKQWPPFCRMSEKPDLNLRAQILEGSSDLEEFGVMLEIAGGEPKHFVIITQLSVIEVVSCYEPELS